MRQEHKASKGIVATSRGGGGNMDEDTIRTNYHFLF